MTFLELAVGSGLVALACEATARMAVRRRTLALLQQVLLPHAPARVTLPNRPLLPRLLLGQIALIRVRCQAAALPTLRLAELDLALHGVRLRADGRVSDGGGILAALIPSEEIGRWVGLPGRVRFDHGAGEVRWLGVPVRFRPRLEDDRIRLTPLPLSLALPTLPPGVAVTEVRACPEGMRVTAAIDVETVFKPTTPATQQLVQR